MSTNSHPIYPHLPATVWTGLYTLAIVYPLFVSEQRSIVLVGVAVAVLAAITYYVSERNLVSLWCFFGAIVSLYLCIYFRALPDFKHGASWPAANPAVGRGL